MTTCATCRHYHHIEGSVLTYGKNHGECREQLHSSMVLMYAPQNGAQAPTVLPPFYPVVPEDFRTCGRYALQLVGANGEAEMVRE